MSDNIVLRMALQGCHYPPPKHQSGTIVCSATTTTGLTVRCELDTRTNPKGAKVCDAKMATLNIEGRTFHREWNYTISPKTEV